jgi:NAD(P)-dependent dehydrogenase (short-subunit alcohol dehydrogenase family)
MPHTLVIGGTRGLGRIVARFAAEAGQLVSVIGRREPADEDRKLDTVRHWVVDAQDHGALASTLNLILAQRGKLSYLVFCQRYRGSGDSWAGEIGITLDFTKSVIEHVQDQFAPEGDRAIVVVSSVFGDFVGEGQALSYHVAKAGLTQMMRYYAVNLGRKGIRVNGVTPFTFLKEESREFYLKNQALQDLYREITPLGRMATAEDSARVIAFLCSPAAGFVNGQNIDVDGGLSLVWPETLERNLKGF